MAYDLDRVYALDETGDVVKTALSVLEQQIVFNSGESTVRPDYNPLISQLNAIGIDIPPRISERDYAINLLRYAFQRNK